MKVRKYLNILISFMFIATMLFSGSGQVFAQGPNPPKGGGGPHTKQGKITQADRQAAADARKAQMQAAGLTPSVNTTMAAPLTTPDYFGNIPNWALSPLPTVDPVTGAISGGIRKFVDTLPGLCGVSPWDPTGAGKGVNELGQCLSIAVPDTNTYTGSDYYVIELGKYTEQLHSDLPATQLEGYRQVNTNDPFASKFSYLGPTIIAQKDRPVRVKFINNLGLDAAGDLFLPVDTTVMGAGMGPNGGTEMYTENRATLHLHGGTTPWISDGTQHQWTTPAGQITSYPQGVSVKNVPDMDGGAEPQGTLTFYYTNQQSARLMFYHDHAYGITRLNVYAGQAAGYVLRDSAEAALETAGVIPGLADNIPLIIQDKTFVPGPTQLAAQDPTWDTAKFGGLGNLWFPHVYMPNQNPWDITGANPMGRWDYGPWFWPPFTGITNGEAPNPLYDPNCTGVCEPPFNPGTPNPSLVPEGFMDTPLVNGTAYPSLIVEPKAYRFRILNAANDRMWNLSLYAAGSDLPMWNPDGTLNNPNAGEVPMVPANPDPTLPFPADWATATGGSGIRPDILDGRVMGVPDPRNLGPSWIQIGTEGGFLPAPVVIPPSPTGYDYNPRNVVVLNVSKHSLMLGPAERADVVVDFSQFAGKTLILYNDGPAPVPAGDPRVDYYTGGPDFTSTGGAPTILPGYGPNTRTIMQIKVAANTPAPYDLSSLQAALPGAYASVQPAPIVPEPQYNQAFGANYPTNFVRIQDTSTSFTNGTIGGFTVTNGGGGYTSVPSVIVSAPSAGGTTAAATAVLAPINVGSLTLTNGGSGYTSAPSVALTGGGGSGAVAASTLAATGSVKSVAVTNGGSGYTSIPTVVFSAPPAGVRATGTAVVSNRRVTSITLTNSGGSGYTSAPTITFTGGGGTGAAATATLGRAVASLTLTNGGSNYTSAPAVSFSGGNGTGAAATAALAGRTVASLTLTAAGSGYVSLPTVTIAAPASGTTAAANAVMAKVLMALQPKAIQELFDPDYGRMNALLGVEVPNTTGLNQTTIPYTDLDPATEIIKSIPTGDAARPIGTSADGTQLWKITHNGVDTHAIHWHMFNVQVVNRVGWDGAVRFPDANELGWKDTVRMNPLEDIIIALRPIKPDVPWDLPNSIRPLDVTSPIGSVLSFANIDPTGQPATVTNQYVNFGWEYVWHCHLLGHEENIMMRPIIIGVAPNAAGTPAAALASGKVTVTWADNSLNETSFTVQRATNANGPWTTLATLPTNTVKYVDTAPVKKTTNFYRVVANNWVGAWSNTNNNPNPPAWYTQAYTAPAVGYPSMNVASAPSANSNSVTP